MKKIVFIILYSILIIGLEVNMVFAFQKKPVKIIVKKKKVVKKKKIIYSNISGHIYLQKGNFMPDPDQPQRKGQPFSGEILIYKLTKMTDTEGDGVSIFTKINTKLVKKVISDKNGKYLVQLPLGKYSMFIKDPEKGIFANIFDGEMNVCPLDVKKGKNPEFDITINHSASY